MKISLANGQKSWFPYYFMARNSGKKKIRPSSKWFSRIKAEGHPTKRKRVSKKRLKRQFTMIYHSESETPHEIPGLCWWNLKSPMTSLVFLKGCPTGRFWQCPHRGIVGARPAHGGDFLELTSQLKITILRLFPKNLKNAIKYGENDDVSPERKKASSCSYRPS